MKYQKHTDNYLVFLSVYKLYFYLCIMYSQVAPQVPAITKVIAVALGSLRHS